MSQATKAYERYDEGRIGVRLLSGGTNGPTLFIFPHAGAQSLAFRALSNELPRSWRVIGLDPPGHGWAAGPPFDDVEEMAKQYVAHIPDEYLDGVVLFGHSLGGLVAYSVAERLQRSGRPVAGLILSATRPPHRRENYVSFAAMDDATLLDVLIQIGGVPASWADEPEVFDYFKESVRADFRAFDRLTSLRPMGNIPMQALGGTEDQICLPEHVVEWTRYAPNCQVDRVPGGHLFVIENAAAVAYRVADFVERFVKATGS